MAQDAEPEEEERQVLELAPELPAPTLEGAEPIGAAEPLPQAPQEEQPAVLARIGTGDHPEWEDDGELPHDISIETPNSFDAPNTPGPQTTVPGGGGGAFYGVAPEQEPPPYVIAVGAGFARYLGSTTPLDFFRVEERFEATLPELSGFRFGVVASQMFADQGYIVGGGVRIGMGVNFCDTGGLQCEGVIYVQPGFLAGLTGPRFDLNANLSLRLLISHLISISADGGYSLLFDGNSLLHVTGSAGVAF